MTERRCHVSGEGRSSNRLPDWAAQGAVVLEFLQKTGRLSEIANQLHVRRHGGYSSLDFVVFAILYFASGLRCGFKEFGRRSAPDRRRLGALAGRKRLMSPSSVSRFLSAVEGPAAHAFGDWLLREGVDGRSLLAHPSTATRDAVGGRWQLFDWDPTVTALRHRALPRGEDLPEPRRRSDASTAPGYSGRKRGDVQLSRGTLQHAGSGLWLQLHVAEGNGEHREASQRAIDAVVNTANAAEIGLDSVVLRADGAAGNVPFMTACTEAGIGWLTRLARYELLDDPEVRAHLDRADWVKVPDSGSGPTRQAAELGTWELPAATGTTRRDGRAYEPVRTRVVVTRFATDEDRGAGVVIDEMKYELFATSLPAEPWPPAEVVACYHGRAGLENRFGQEDRELGLDHVFSYRLPGQALVSAIGLFVWNVQTLLGFELESPPLDLPAQERAQPRQAEGGPSLDASASRATRRPETRSPPPSPSPPPPLRHLETEPFSKLRNEMNAIYDVIHRRLPEGWQWDDKRVGLICPRGAYAVPQTVYRASRHKLKVRFNVAAVHCRTCPLRSGCTNSVTPDFQKRIDVSVAKAIGRRLMHLLKRTGRIRRALVREDRERIHGDAQPRHRRPDDPVHPIGPTTPEPSRRADNWESEIAPPPQRPVWVGLPTLLLCGLMLSSPGVLLPAVLRRAFQQACESVEISLSITGKPFKPQPACYAPTAAHRQHRRLTYQELRDRMALPPPLAVDIHLNTPHVRLRKLLEQAETQARSAIPKAA